MKIKTGDTVRVLTGKDKGKTGKVIQVFPKHRRIAIAEINKAVRHLRRASKTQPGQKIEFTAPIHISNVEMFSPVSGKAGRVAYKFIQKEGQSKKIRALRTKDGLEDLI